MRIGDTKNYLPRGSRVRWFLATVFVFSLYASASESRFNDHHRHPQRLAAQQVTMEQAINRTNTSAVTPDALLKYLKSLKISFIQYHHPAVFTVKEAKLIRGNVPGEHCKSLFLMDKAGALYLIVCLEWRRLDMRALAELLGSKRLSFGKPKFCLLYTSPSPRDS